MAIVPANSPVEQTILVLVLFFYLTKFSRYRNQLHQDLNPGQFWRVVAFIPLILMKQITFGLVAVLLSCLVFELQKLSSLGLEQVGFLGL
jgi:tellurite resistance protein TehA-like permease